METNELYFLKFIDTVEYLLNEDYVKSHDCTERHSDDGSAGSLEDPDYIIDEGTLADAQEKARSRHKRFVWFYLGRVLYNKPHTVYEDHKRYFMTQVCKPHDETIVDYTSKMREYAEIFTFLIPAY